MRFGLIAIGFAGSLVGTAGIAQDASVVPVERAAAVFGARDKVIDASLSPDGQKVAFIVPGPAQSTVIQIVDAPSGNAKAINYADGNPLSLLSCGWVNDKRLICRQYGIADDFNDINGYIRLAALDADGNNITPLGSRERNRYFEQGSDGYVVDWRDGTTDQVLLARSYVPIRAQIRTGPGSLLNGLGVDLIDTTTGKTKQVEAPHEETMSYMGDGQGNIRIRSTYADLRFKGDIPYDYRLPGSKDWKRLGSYSTVNETGIQPLAVDSTQNAAYVLQKENGRWALGRIMLDGTLKSERIYAHPQVDVDGVITIGRQGRVVGASFATDQRQSVYFDPTYAKMVAALGRALPATPMITIVDSSADEKIHLVHASSDIDAGRYYLFDSGKKTLKELAASRPDAAGMPIGRMQPINYTAGDGTKIPAYLSVPPGGPAKGLPAIVMPHGGPSSRDEWGFDWLVQFFVTRGYAVIQPNYRGSAGFGDEWYQENGFRSWKTAIGDVNDAGRWLVKEGIADPNKLAIVGWSYGGYAALQANVLDPKLFKAAVAIAPVTDLDMLRGEKRGALNATHLRDFIGDGPQLVEGSPARNASKFAVPVLMFHGEYDLNVRINQARFMDEQLKKAGKRSELVVYPRIDHGLRDGTVRADMLTKTDNFLRAAMKM
jgi:dipeptidyl aminopeptidase/acylaminoacyl peptidase